MMILSTIRGMSMVGPEQAVSMPKLNWKTKSSSVIVCKSLVTIVALDVTVRPTSSCKIWRERRALLRTAG